MEPSGDCRGWFWRLDALGVVCGLMLSIAALGGCGGKSLRPAPPTYPVTGEVKAPEGRIPKGAQIEFRPVRETQADALTARGVIDPAGNFELKIPFVDRVLPGATEGPHTVRIVFSAGNNPTTEFGSGQITVTEQFTVQPQENHFTITLPKQ